MSKNTILTNTLSNIGSASLSLSEFNWIKDYLYKNAGIVLHDGKQAMVMGRLEKRLRNYGLNRYSDYFALFGQPGFEQEASVAIDLLTTNETYFFRESKHFDFLVQKILPAHPSTRGMRIWSAASSSGEEAYTLAMLLAHFYKFGQWEVIGTDISTRIIEKARRGMYPEAAAEKIPSELLKKYCLRGTGEYQGFMLIAPEISKYVKFLYANLIGTLPDLGGQFDVIFLRNVMIYFDMPTKQVLLQKIVNYLKPDGHFIISHSESLTGLNVDLKSVSPSIYQKTGKA